MMSSIKNHHDQDTLFSKMCKLFQITYLFKVLFAQRKSVDKFTVPFIYHNTPITSASSTSFNKIHNIQEFFNEPVTNEGDVDLEKSKSFRRQHIIKKNQKKRSSHIPPFNLILLITFLVLEMFGTKSVLRGSANSGLYVIEKMKY